MRRLLDSRDSKGRFVATPSGLPSLYGVSKGISGFGVATDKILRLKEAQLK